MVEREANKTLSSHLSRVQHVIRETHRVFIDHECALRAAGLAYHLLLSLFPLLLFLIFLGSRLLSLQGIRRSLDSYLEEVLPAIAGNVGVILDQTLRVRGTIEVIGGVLLLWSASAVFISLSSTLNVIWGASPRSFWRRRVLAILTVLIIGSLFIVSVWLGAFIPWSWSGTNSALWRWLRLGMDLGVTVLLLGLLYRILPNRWVAWRAAFLGASLAGFLWQIAKGIFAWFITSGLNNYGLVYGSLASIVSLLLWIYLSGVIVYVGAAFGSVLEGQVQASGERRNEYRTGMNLR